MFKLRKILPNITVIDTRKKHLQIVEQFQNNGRQANAFGNIVYIFTQRPNFYGFGVV